MAKQPVEPTPPNLPAVVDVTGFALMQFDRNELAEAIQENLGGERLTIGDLDRVKIPAGGGTIWEVPDMDEVEDTKTLEGVIIYWKPGRVFWAESFEEGGGGTPPDCASDDGKCGVGNPGGTCEGCIHNEWESSTKGRGKACKEVRQVFMLRGNSLLPILVTLPPTSIKPFRVYMRQLLQRGLSYSKVVTRLTLEKTQQKGGGSIVYSVVHASMVGTIPDEQHAAIKAYGESIRPMLSSLPTTADAASAVEHTESEDVDGEE